MDKVCKKLRRDILRASYYSKACHIGSALSCVEIIWEIYRMIGWRDIFIFSKASGVAALYAVLAEKKYFRADKLTHYMKKYPLGNKDVPGVLINSGSLGHGLPIAVGVALAQKQYKTKDSVYCLMSDGELQEGTTWESMLFARHHKLDNLVVVIDRNGFQACGKTEDILELEPLGEKFSACDWSVYEINGHNNDNLRGVFIGAKHSLVSNDKPRVVIAHTIKGKGVDFMENNNDWHYKNLDAETYKKAIRQLADEEGGKR